MASINDINFLPQIDYTARDYTTIKAGLVKYVQTYFPNDYTDFTESGLGAVFLEMIAYVGDQLSFYLDRQVNEMFLPTAVQRESVLNLVNLIGYVPRSTSAAVAPIQMTLNIAQTDPTVVDPYTIFEDKDGNPWELLETITIPAGRVDTTTIAVTDEVLGQGDGATTVYSFLTENDNLVNTSVILKITIAAQQYIIQVNNDGTVPVPFGGTGLVDFDTGQITLNFVSGSAPDAAVNMLVSYTYNQNITAYQGTTKLDVFSSDGSADQMFVLSNSPVLIAPRVEEVEISPNPNRFEVWVGDPSAPFGSGTGSKWTRVDSLATVGPTEEVYSIRFDDQNRLVIEFGDDGAGLIPPVGVNNLHVVYRVGGGVKGNVSAGFISSSVTGTAGLLAVTVGVSNYEAATGGRERESLNEIRINAPAFLKTNDTATTETDYDTLALFTRSGLGSITRAKSRQTPSETFVTKTVHTAEVLGSIPVGVPIEYFLLLPAVPILVATASIGYSVGGVARAATASDLGGGLADLIGDATLDVASRWRYDSQDTAAETLDFGTGVKFDFSGTLNDEPVFPGSVIFRYTIGGSVRVGYDDGSGLLLGSDVSAGTINYVTGAVTIEFGTQAAVTSGNTEPFDMNAIGNPVTLTVTIDGGAPQGFSLAPGDVALFNAVTAAEVKAKLDATITGATVSVVAGAVVITSDTFGPLGSVLITAGAPNDMNDATTGLNMSTTIVNGTGTAPDVSTAISFDYRSCMRLLLTSPPDAGTDITFSAESGPSVKEFPSNNVEVYTWAEDSEGNLVAPTSALKDNLKNDLDTKRVLGTSVEVLSGFNVKLGYKITVNFDPSINQVDATAAIVAGLEEYFSSVVDVAPGVDVSLASVYDAIFPIQGVTDPVITEVTVRVPVATGDGIASIFSTDSTIPGRFVSTGKLPAKDGADNIKVYRNNTEIGSSNASTPTVGLSGGEVIIGSTFNITTGATSLRINPPPPRDEVISIDFILDEEAVNTIWNVEINSWEIAILGDVHINGTKVN